MREALGLAGEQTEPDAVPAARRVLVILAWMAALVATIWGLGKLGTGALSPPPLRDGGDLQRWLDGRDAVTTAFALVRLLGLALAWYLVAVTVLAVVARASRIPALVRLADVTTIPAVRRVLTAVAGAGLTASATSFMAASQLPGAQPGSSPAVGSVHGAVVLERLADRSEVVLRRLPDQEEEEEEEEGTATMRVDDGEGDDVPPDPAPPDPAPPDPAPPDPAPAAPHQWRVVAGDHLWHIAESTVGADWGRVPTEAEVTPYWSAVIDANRATLVDPANPDLIIPGQVLVLPDVPPAPPLA